MTRKRRLQEVDALMRDISKSILMHPATGGLIVSPADRCPDLADISTSTLRRLHRALEAFRAEARADAGVRSGHISAPALVAQPGAWPNEKGPR
jgi:hypothetical protein